MSQLAGRKRHRPALHQQRQQHDDEGDVEKQIGARQPDQQRDRRQEDADRAAQADPGNEQLLAPLVIERRQAQEHRRRRAISISVSAMAIAPSRLPASRCGQTSRPSSTNITICASHVAASRNGDDRVVRAGLPVADDQPGEIDREKARRVHGVGEGEDDQRARPRRTARAGLAPASGD